jgi:hypothetical protein
VIVGELELVVLLDARELGISQAWPDFALACPGQPAGGLPAQPCPFTADHSRTVTAEVCCTGSAALPGAGHPAPGLAGVNVNVLRPFVSDQLDLGIGHQTGQTRQNGLPAGSA